jgi:hypothetical protein
MFDLAFISIGMGVVVGTVQLLSYLNGRQIRKEVAQEKINIAQEKFVKADNIQVELSVIREGIARNEKKLEEHDDKISELNSQNAVCISQHNHTTEDMNKQLRVLERLDEKLDEALRDL